MAPLADRLRAGETAYCGWSVVGDPLTAEAVARAGFDAVCLDTQHGYFGFRDLAAAVTAVSAAGSAPLVRVPHGAWPEVSRALDMGAEGVICPMVNTAEDARRLASAMKFPPLGTRSWGPHRANMLWGTGNDGYIGQANDRLLALAMVETREAIANLPEILATPGIDGVLVGPNDLSVALTGGRAPDPADASTAEAVAEICRQTLAAKKIATIFANTAELAHGYREMGYAMIAHGSDLAMVQAGSATALKALKGA
ncbi:HpcH/HpaI aldolase family protein [Lutibaculum baratangense]|uniref:2,4-dihydroxyhept-2-ene-1,7-dioic acid aldolase n=1 Tax=Lutibaculum baratangense AMV1 TaxID=631454 RepID=V4QRT7_9HYPH|nr:aldolase/citrate lyase family protein [Lutibaculum baratangense]ESR22452.1 2,4-dihydroxyhept-2-ene-1,7-dioic acid aldolase [Lutibaculum baratangense AMV1]